MLYIIHSSQVLWGCRTQVKGKQAKSTPRQMRRKVPISCWGKGGTEILTKIASLTDMYWTTNFQPIKIVYFQLLPLRWWACLCSAGLLERRVDVYFFIFAQVDNFPIRPMGDIACSIAMKVLRGYLQVQAKTSFCISKMIALQWGAMKYTSA